MTTDRIKALVDLGPELQKRYDSRSVMNPTGSILLTYEEAPTILAAIEALTPIASGTSVVVPREPTEEICNKLRAVLPELFDTSDDTLQEIYTDILAASPASPAPSDEGMVERVARAIWNVDAHPARKNWDEAIQSDDYAEALNDCRAYARAALAAINEIGVTTKLQLEAAARIEELEEALKPFAEIEHSKYEPDDGPAFIEGVIQRLPTVGDLRRAARAYANKGEQT